MKVLTTLVHTVSLMMIIMIRPCTSIGAYMEMIINNGIGPLVSKPCTTVEESRVEWCFTRSGVRKLLRSATNTSIQSQQEQRQAYPLVCKDLCAGYIAKTCRARRCEGYRRELNGELDLRYCNQTITNTNDCLDKIALISASASCKAFYNPKNRTATCRLFEMC